MCMGGIDRQIKLFRLKCPYELFDVVLRCALGRLSELNMALATKCIETGRRSRYAFYIVCYSYVWLCIVCIDVSE